jgi:N-acetylneuraminic acid mutarotase
MGRWLALAAAASLALPVAAHAAVGGWTPTGSMTTARDQATATLLGDGDVLVAGGTVGSGSLATAELYDPSTQTWAPTGSLPATRQSAAATLLDDGDVLVVGGTGSGSFALATAELYDPSTQTWSSAGSMSTGRLLGTATLLDDGDVLVTGGLGPGPDFGPTASAELYDPSTNTWSSAGAMSIVRVAATATLLPDGEVLVAGGGTIVGTTATVTQSAELYDPATNAWTTTGSMITDRASATSTLLGDGDVLVAGGTTDPQEGNAIASAELYDPGTGIWSATGALTAPRVGASATLLFDGDVLEAGGSDPTGTPAADPLATAELYDPATHTWTSTGVMSAPRFDDTATVLDDGQVLVAGGEESSNAGSSLSSAELYQPAISPFVTGVTASDVSATGALLQGGVDPEDGDTSYHFDLGTDAQFSSVISTPATDAGPGAGITPTTVSAQASGLTPATTYFVRLVATNSQGRSTSATQHFVTTAAAGPPTPPTTTADPPARKPPKTTKPPRVPIVHLHRAAGGGVLLTLRARTGGRITLRTTTVVKGHTRTFTRSFRIAAGHEINAGAAMDRWLRRIGHHLTATLTVTYTSARTTRRVLHRTLHLPR